MQFTTVFFALVALCLALVEAAPQKRSTVTMTINNNCTNPVDVKFLGTAAEDSFTIKSNGTQTVDMPTPAMGTVFKVIDAEKGTWLKPAQFELSLGGWDGMDAYDISYIDGNGEIASASMKPVGGSGNCDDLVCEDAENCKYAYYLPDDVQTYTCTGPDAFEVNLCIA